MIKISDIEWDTEGDNDLDLPSEIEIDEEDFLEEYELDDIDGVEDCIADYLSDRYGYCIISFVCE